MRELQCEKPDGESGTKEISARVLGLSFLNIKRATISNLQFRVPFRNASQYEY
jgi:hypothetical protein